MMLGNLSPVGFECHQVKLLMNLRKAEFAVMKQKHLWDPVQDKYAKDREQWEFLLIASEADPPS